MKLVAISLSVAAVSLLSSCESDQSPETGAYSQPAQNPYGENGYPSPYGAPPGPYPQNGDYVDVSPVSPDPYAGSGSPAPAETYQPPAYGSQPTYSPPAPPVIASNSTGSSYQVARGDTLYSISRRYGTTIDALKQANGLSSDMIRAGDVLAIP